MGFGIGLLIYLLGAVVVGHILYSKEDPDEIMYDAASFICALWPVALVLFVLMFICVRIKKLFRDDF